MALKKDFWKNRTLEELSIEEWEALCDHCALCCYNKVQDADTGEVFYLNEPCHLLDPQKKICKHYQERHQHVPECAVLTPETVREFDWLPATCAYRLILLGKDLPDWHPLKQEEAF